LGYCGYFIAGSGALPADFRVCRSGKNGKKAEEPILSLAEHIERLEQYLSTGKFDWSSFYWRIKRSRIGHDERFSADKFGEQSVCFIFDAWEKAWELEKEERKLLSRPFAIFCTDYFNSKVGESVVSIERYLPFVEESQAKIPLSRTKASWIWEVICSGILHPKWIGVLGEEMKEIKILAEREK
jgi:hypothetical protein